MDGTCWEYSILRVPTNNLGNLHVTLNNAGLSGWEVVGFAQVTEPPVSLPTQLAERPRVLALSRTDAVRGAHVALTSDLFWCLP